MVVLRADPWAPEYGMGFEARADDPLPVTDPLVETADWSMPLSPGPAPDIPVWFIDGVRRAELRLQVEDAGIQAPGLFGSFAVGAVCCDGKASLVEQRVGRAVVAAGGIMPDPVEVRVGGHRALYRPETDPYNDPDRPIQRLQQLMLREEARLAGEVASTNGRLVVVDGPLRLSDPTDAPVVGMVKRFVRHYLDPDRERLLGRLAPGQRTPLFAAGSPAQPVQRYAWYTRLAILEGPWHDQAGVVRCEVRAGVGIQVAVGLADQVSVLLPRYAGRPSDPRTPQNLVPVAGLETSLRHRMGDARMLRRALLVHLARAA